MQTIGKALLVLGLVILIAKLPVLILIPALIVLGILIFAER